MRAYTFLPVVFLAAALSGCPDPGGGDAGDVVRWVDDGPRFDAVDVQPDTRDVPDAPDAADAADVVDAGDVATPCAFDAIYTYGYEGGEAAFTETTTLSPENAYTRRRVTPDSVLMCSAAVPACGAAVVTVGDVMGTLTDPDVRAAFAGPPNMVYGADLRPMDGQVFRVRRGPGEGFFIGGPCGGAPGCVEVPEGLAFLQAQLAALDNQQLALPECEPLR